MTLLVNNDTFAVVNTERRVMVFNFSSPSQIVTFPPDEHKRMINKLVWHPEKADWLLTVSSDHQMKLFDKDPRAAVLTFSNSSAGYLDAKFAKWDTNAIAAAKENGEIEVIVCC